MPEKGAQEKTEKPTSRRKSKARKEGRVAKSQELGSVAVLTAGLSSLWLFGGFFYDRITGLMSHIMSTAGQSALGVGDLHGLASSVLHYYLVLVMPVMGAVVVAAVLVNLAQVGFLWAPKRMKPDLSKINPLEGFKKFVSLRILVDLFKNLGKLVVVGTVGYYTIVDEWDTLPLLVDMDLATALKTIITICLKIFLRCLVAMVVLAILDWAYQKYDFEKNLKMTKQEVKDEFKQSEGDPKVKSRIRSLQYEQARKRMMASVPEADVVITNPTHLAVALKYEVGVMEAPEVLAKGAGKLAERIKDLARQNNVPIVEDKPLAQALYKSVEVGGSIPYELYEAIATILAHVYRQSNRHRQFLAGQGAGA